MKDILHENLVRFIGKSKNDLIFWDKLITFCLGLCIDEPNYATVNELMIRGSLRDLLETVGVCWLNIVEFG